MIYSLLFSVFQAQASESGVITQRANNIKRDYDFLSAGFESRDKFFSDEEAIKYFERALNHYLLANYESSALEFQILVESHRFASVQDEMLAEWLMADSAFQSKNYSHAILACNSIISGGGEGHIYYKEAVLLLLEIYSITKQERSFTKTYNRFIKRKKMPIDDRIRYATGKSFYFQGKIEKSLGELNDIPPESKYFAKAQYFLGGIQVGQGDFTTALRHFEQSHISAEQFILSQEEETPSLSLLRQKYHSNLSQQKNNDTELSKVEMTQIDAYVNKTGVFGSLAVISSIKNLSKRTARWFKEKYTQASKERQLAKGVISEEDLNALYNSNLDYIENVKVLELSILAKARISLEQGLGSEAFIIYQSIPPYSEYYIDSLHEQVYNSIAMEQWSDAANLIKVFRLLYPDEEYTLDLENLQGDLYLKDRDFENAIVAYENISESIGPVFFAIKNISSDQKELSNIYQSLIHDEELPIELPPYALDVFLDQKELKKSLEYSKTLIEDKKEVEEMLSSLKELDALFSVRKSLGGYDNGRDVIRDMKIDSILFYFDIIDNSITEVLPKVEEYDRKQANKRSSNKKSIGQSSEGGDLTEKQKLLQDFKELSSEITMVLEQGKTAKNLKNDYRSKILNLENDGKELLEILYSYRDHISSLRDVFDKVRTDLDEDIVLLIDDLFPAIEKEINEIIIIVERLVSEERINNLLGSIELITNVEVVDYDTTFYKLKKYYEEDLPKTIQRCDSGNASQYTAAFNNETEIVLDVYRKLPTLSEKLKKKEQGEFAYVEKILEKEMKEISDLTELSVDISTRLDSIGRVMTDKGLQQTKKIVEDRVAKADYGIINVFYERREEINLEKERLVAEKKQAQLQVQETMDYINSKLATYEIEGSDSADDSSDDSSE
jgi:hypothetical protein